MRTASSWLPLLLVVATGCYATDGVYTEPAYADGTYDGNYANGTPDMVDVSPGVQVVGDYDYPVFFSGGMYWRNYGGAWYSSNVYNGGWALAGNVPYGVSSIRDPGMYAHYRGGYGGGYRGGYEGGYRGPNTVGYRGPNEGGFRGGVAGGYRGPSNVGGYRGPSGGGGGGFRPGTYRGAGFRGGGAPAYHGGGGGSPGGGFHSAGGGGGARGGGRRR